MRRSTCLAWSFAIAWVGSAGGTEPPAKLIAAGWDRPTPARYRRELPAFERPGIFQGATILPTRRTGRGEVQSNKAFAAEDWRWADFREAVDDLRAARSSTVTETFLLINANPGDVDWFDDEGWARVVDHWRLLARAARKGGLRGLLFDAEPYTPPHEQFHYARQPGRAGHPFPEYAAKARERGRAVIRAVASEMPEGVILCFRLLCDLRPIAEADGDASGLLAAHPYGLMPGFVDGWLDAIPPGLRVVEGNEDAYRYNSPGEFDRAYARLRVDCARLLSPENRARYRAQVDIGHGLYLDAYTNPPGDPWSIDLKGSTPAARLEANLADAIRAGDGYAWVYGEKGRWWPGGDPKFPPWDRKLPGASEAILRASRPLAAASALLDDSSTANALVDGSFEEAEADRSPRRWWSWQARGGEGRFSVAEGGRSAEVRGVQNGYLGQDVAVEPGATVAVTARARKVGAGVVAASIRWKSGDGRWIPAAEDVILTPTGPPDPGGWTRLVALARAPASSAKLVLLLGAREQSADGVVGFAEARMVVRPPGR